MSVLFANCHIFQKKKTSIIPTCLFPYMYIISLILSVAFPRGRLCENVLEGSSHHHVHAQRAGGQILPGGQSRPARQQTQTGLGVSFHLQLFFVFLTGSFKKKEKVLLGILKSNLLGKDWPVMY